MKPRRRIEWDDLLPVARNLNRRGLYVLFTVLLITLAGIGLSIAVRAYNREATNRILSSGKPSSPQTARPVNPRAWGGILRSIGHWEGSCWLNLRA